MYRLKYKKIAFFGEFIEKTTIIEYLSQIVLHFSKKSKIAPKSI